MFKKMIEFEDYDGVKRSEDFYFNMNKSEVIKFLTTTGDYTLDKLLIRLGHERNGKKIMEIFEELLKISYGERDLDSRRFIKNQEVWEKFYQTEAYSNLFFELVTDANKAVEFIKSIMPKEMIRDIQKIVAENPDAIPEELKEYLPKNSAVEEVPNEIPTPGTM